MLNEREPKGLSANNYDLIVVGGGFHGIMVALEAVRRGLRPLLVERGDFGTATSHNSLRIVHGGLRYLQSLDFSRSLQSLGERRWFIRNFPDLVQRLSCLIPLYGEGLHRPTVLRAALTINDLLSWRRNVGVPDDLALPAGSVLDPRETRELFPSVDSRGLVGAGLWHDAFIPNAPRVMIESLHWACAHGACVLNYVEARDFLVAKGRIEGIEAVDKECGEEITFRASVVVNAAGPWAPGLAAKTGAKPEDFPPSSIAWNVVVNRKPPSQYAVAVRPRRPGGRSYFLLPWKGVLLAGTGHAAWPDGPEKPVPSKALMDSFISDVNEAIPSLDFGERDIARVFSGLLPATGPGSSELAVRHVVVEHGAQGGAKGLYSICGIKLTTSRFVADEVLSKAFPAARPSSYAQFRRQPRAEHEQPDYAFSWMPDEGDNAWKEPLSGAIAQEAVLHLDDLVLRRSAIGDNPERALALASETCKLFNWDAARRSREIAGLRDSLGLAPAETGPAHARAGGGG